MNTGPNTVKDLQELASKHVEMAKHEWVPDDAKRLCYKTARALESAARTIDEWHNETQMQVTIPLTGTEQRWVEAMRGKKAVDRWKHLQIPDETYPTTEANPPLMAAIRKSAKRQKKAAKKR
jgi:hypothetical protein